MNEAIVNSLIGLVYLASAILFILGLKMLSRVRTARRGNLVAALAMLLAIVGTLLEMGLIDYRWIIAGWVVGSAIGIVLAYKVPMTAMPETVGALNGFGGGASTLVAIAFFWGKTVDSAPGNSASTLMGLDEAIITPLSIFLGAVTFSGSFAALLKLQGMISDRPVLLRGRHVINAGLLLVCVGASLGFLWANVAGGLAFCFLLTVLSLVLGVLLVLPIGGADMPVVISYLNALSGLAAAATGFVLSHPLLIIGGALVGASGLFLTHIMCVGMNRSLANVVFGGFGVTAAPTGSGEYENIRSATPEEVASVLAVARSVIIVPGYGLAVAQAQHAARELADWLQKNGTKVTFAIHPVAGRMPGHMNVLLAEANVPYEQLNEMEHINPEFPNTDAVLVIGANDVVNPAAQKQPNSPLYGMPILEAFRARCIYVIKRGRGAGFAGVKNELFEYPNTWLVFGDAKKVLQELMAELKSGQP